MFSFFRKQEFFSPEEKKLIVEAIQNAEKNTSGEIRVFVENRCSYMDAIDRAGEIFYNLDMQKTAQRNGVLVYVALTDHQLALFGDEGIHQKVGTAFWQKEVSQMIKNFNKENYADGIKQCVLDIGEALQSHFPYDGKTDKNELPDDIVFGR